MVRLVCFIDNEEMPGTCPKRRADCEKCNFPKTQDDKDFVYRAWDKCKEEDKKCYSGRT